MPLGFTHKSAGLLLVLSLTLAGTLTACQKGPVVPTSDGAGNIRGIDGIALGSALSAPPAGFHQDHATLWGTAYVKTEQATVAGVPAKKEVQVFLDKGAVSQIALVLTASSEPAADQLGAAVLAGLKAEYGSKLQVGQSFSIAEDSQGRSLNYAKGSTIVSITLK